MSTSSALAAATHAVLSGNAMQNLADNVIDRVVVTDTIPTAGRCDPISEKLDVLSVGPLLGEAIKRIHNDDSVSALFRNSAGPKR